MTYLTPESAIAQPVGPIEGDLACRKCGYNLRGLDGEGRCPECGTAVGYSARGDFLRYSDPDWLARLRRGMTLILIAVLVTVLVTVATVVLLSTPTTSTTAVAVLPFVSLVVQAIWYVGIWLLTESDPSGLGEDDYGRIRRFIRVAMLVNVASTALAMTLQFATIPDALAIGLTVIATVAGFFGLAGFCCQLVYLSRLARRLPDERLAQRAKSLAWTIGISYGIVLAFRILTALLIRPMLAGVRPQTAMFTAVSCVSGLAGLALLIAGIFYLLLLERFGKRLKVEEQIARQTWAAGAAPVG